MQTFNNFPGHMSMDVVAAPSKVFREEDYPSKPVLIQGRPFNPAKPTPVLFMVVDGGGSAAVYVHIPKLAPGLSVYALESPFIGDEKEIDFFLPGVTIDGVASIFAKAIRSVQPHGPYMVGGYSVGGVFAFQTVKHLIATGDRVHGFLTLDTACPRNMKGILEVNVDVCQRMGLYDSLDEDDALARKPLTREQKIHVAGCTRCAGNFDPEPIPAGMRPEHNFCVWARKGFVSHLSDKIIEEGHKMAEEQGRNKMLDPEWLAWLESEKTSYGPRGWELLLGNVETFVLEGDHFSIIMRPDVSFSPFATFSPFLSSFTVSFSFAAIRVPHLCCFFFPSGKSGKPIH
jgi:thioesterase domain-containing protein